MHDYNLLGCDLFNGLHEDLSYDRNTQEEIYEAKSIANGEEASAQRGNSWNQKGAPTDFRVLTEVNNSSAIEFLHLHGNPLFAVPRDLGLVV